MMTTIQGNSHGCPKALGALYARNMLHACLLLLVTTSVKCQRSGDVYAQILNVGQGNFVAEYTWYIDDILNRIELAKLSGSGLTSDIILSEEFYLGKPGYKARLSLSPYRNNTKDGASYMGEYNYKF